jgi:hypothetical protein
MGGDLADLDGPKKEGGSIMKISVEVWRMSNEPGLIHLASSDGKTFDAQVSNVEGRAGYYSYLYGKLEGMLEVEGEEPVVRKTQRG